MKQNTVKVVHSAGGYYNVRIFYSQTMHSGIQIR